MMICVFKILCWLHEPGRQKGEKTCNPDVKQGEEKREVDQAGWDPVADQKAQ